MASALASVAILLLFVGVQLFGGRIVALASDPTSIGDDRSVGARVAIYEIALNAFRDHPLTGVGPDNFEVAFPTYRPERFYSLSPIVVPDTSAHSWLASIVSDAGIAGLLMFAVLLATLGFVTWRRPSQIAIVGWTLVLTYLAEIGRASCRERV